MSVIVNIVKPFLNKLININCHCPSPQKAIVQFVNYNNVF